MEEDVIGQRTERRRRHSAEFKAQAITSCMQPGVSIAAVALHYRLNANLLRRWVADQEEQDLAAQARLAMTSPHAEFVPLQAPGPAVPVVQDIVIEVQRGAAIVKAIDYSVKRWVALTRYLDDGGFRSTTTGWKTRSVPGRLAARTGCSPGPYGRDNGPLPS
jgi:transposase